MGHKEWKMPTAVREDGGLEAAGFTPLLGLLLGARGFHTAADAERYLARDASLLADPMLLDDMDKAVARILTRLHVIIRSFPYRKKTVFFI